MQRYEKERRIQNERFFSFVFILERKYLRPQVKGLISEHRSKEKGKTFINETTPHIAAQRGIVAGGPAFN